MVIACNYHPPRERATISALCLFFQGIGVILNTPSKYITYCTWSGLESVGQSPFSGNKTVFRELKCLTKGSRYSSGSDMLICNGLKKEKKKSKMMQWVSRHQNENITGIYFHSLPWKVPKHFFHTISERKQRPRWWYIQQSANSNPDTAGLPRGWSGKAGQQHLAQLHQ